MNTGAPPVAVRTAGPPVAAAETDGTEVDRVIRPGVLAGGTTGPNIVGVSRREGYPQLRPEGVP